MKYTDIPQFPKIKKSHHTEWENIQHQFDWYCKSFDLDLDPDFQRGHVWTEEQQAAYIEFKLQGGKGGDDVYLNAPDYLNYTGKLELVDGKQRLTAILKFLSNDLKIFGSFYYEDLETRGTGMRLSFDLQIVFNINSLNDQEKLRWYISLNSGVAHTQEELDRVKAMIR